MRTYLTFIKYLQTAFLAVSLAILAVFPILIAFWPDIVMPQATAIYAIAHGAVLFVMVIRPLADILTPLKFIRPLVILRKGVGVFSASLVISFTFAKIIVDPVGFASTVATLPYWSLEGYALLAHLADWSAFLLLITSNNFSKRILGSWWKRIQRLSYVYFFASALYVYIMYTNIHVLYYMLIVFSLTSIAFMLNRLRLYERTTATL